MMKTKKETQQQLEMDHEMLNSRKRPINDLKSCVVNHSKRYTFENFTTYVRVFFSFKYAENARISFH